MSVTSAPASRRLASMAANTPAGPPPMTTMCRAVMGSCSQRPVGSLPLQGEGWGGSPPISTNAAPAVRLRAQGDQQVLDIVDGAGDDEHQWLPAPSTASRR